jgi:hypothetical protein
VDALTNHFAAFVQQLRSDGVLTDPRGCSSEEVRHLESIHACKLPRAYRMYLETMGHSAGKLFSHDHLAVTYEHLVELRSQLDEAMAEDCKPGAPAFRLPEHAFVIAGRLGEQFEYIVCDRPDESPVYYVSTWERVPKLSHPTILAWLECWHTQSVDAIRSGYFDRYPNGTVP